MPTPAADLSKQFPNLAGANTGVSNVINTVLHWWPFLMPLLPSRLCKLLDGTLKANISVRRPSRKLAVTEMDLSLMIDYLKTGPPFWGTPLMSEYFLLSGVDLLIDIVCFSEVLGLPIVSSGGCCWGAWWIFTETF